MNPANPTPQSESEQLGKTTHMGPHLTLLQRMKSSLPRRTRWLLGSVVVLGLLALAVGQPFQRQCLTFLLLRSDAPSPEALLGLVEQTGNPQSLLLNLWHTQRIPQRHFVLGYLSASVGIQTNLFHAMEPVLMEAASDADLATRELAFTALTRARHPQLHSLVQEQLKDVDPAARLLGLRSLRSMAGSNEVPGVVAFLSDTDPRVVVAAGLVLQRATGQDFGFKSHLALPRFTSSDRTNPPSPPDLPAIRQGLQLWHKWWKDHRGEYSAPSQPSRERLSAAPLPVADFRLEDSNGKLASLSDYKGKLVLLAFWSLDAPVALEDAPALNALHSRDVAVLGICVPPVPSCADEHQHDHGTEHAHHQHNEASSPAMSPSQTRALVQGIIREKKINYPILIDEKGKVGLRFDVEDLPTYVLIDAQGVIRRLFTGNRTQPVLEAMVHEAVGAKSKPKGN